MGTHGGWAVPLSYTGPLEEADLAASSGVVTDVSYLSRIRIRGDGALDLLERACTHDVAHQEDDTAAASCLCNDRGGVVDLGYLLRLESEWLWTGDAGNREKTLEHLTALANGLDVKLTDRTAKTAHLAVLGPQAAGKLDAVLPFTVSDLPPHAIKAGSLLIAKYTASRIAYADLWGLEVVLPAMTAGQAWRFITDKAGENALPPMGQAGRDILRIRAGLPRYGHEVNETIDPITAGLERCVHTDHEFIGCDALAEIARKGPARRLCTLALSPPDGAPAARAVPRLGDAVTDADGAEVGRVTSGTLAGQPLAPIALAYLSAARLGETTDPPFAVQTAAGSMAARLASPGWDPPESTRNNG